MEVNGEVKVYTDFAADVGGDVEARSFKDITLWTPIIPGGGLQAFRTSIDMLVANSI